MSTVERPGQRPRSKSTFSFKSDKSHKSRDSKGAIKQDVKSVHQRHHSKDEHKPHFHTKADPNSAMSEAQPIAAALEKPTLQSLRSFQHTDVNGNPIEEPDLSNPTRPRWERPLDTIRSFEAAIDNEYKRRSMAARGDSDVYSNSRRNSYYSNAHENNGRTQSGYYGNRQSAVARESWADQAGYQAGPGPRTRYHRQHYDNGWNGRQSTGPQSVYPTPGYHQSRDTVMTGGTNGSSSQQSEGHYSTDPSSEHGSIDRGGPVKQPDLGEQYGFSGFGNNSQPIHEELGNYNYSNGQGNGSNGYYQQHQQQQQQSYDNPPPVPQKGNGQPMVNNPNVMKANVQQNGGGPPAANGGRPGVLTRKGTETSEKRKSWFKKRFSKN